MDNKKLLSEVKKVIQERIRVERVILFGSRARGVFHADSDYDLAVISKDLEGMNFDKRQLILRPLIRKVIGYAPLDVVCYTPEEFERGKAGFLPQTIEEEGVSV